MEKDITLVRVENPEGELIQAQITLASHLSISTQGLIIAKLSREYGGVDCNGNPEVYVTKPQGERSEDFLDNLKRILGEVRVPRPASPLVLLVVR